MTRELPGHTDILVIGGGVIGLATAYNLAKTGHDVVLLEREAFGSGSTSKSAGGVRAQFSDRTNIELGKYGLAEFTNFERLYGVEIDFQQVGYLFLLDNHEDVATFEASVRLQNELGVPSRMLTPTEAQELSPFISSEGILAAAFSPTDGHCTPEAVCQGYASAARRCGATLIPNCEVLGVDVGRSGTQVVHTSRGEITVERVVIAAGAWSGQVGAWFDVDLPVEPLRRQIIITEPVRNLRPDTPMTIDFSSSFYFHNEGPSLLIGMSDPEETPGFKLDRDDAWFPNLIAAIERRAPQLTEFGISTGWAGLYEMSPDANGLIGRAENMPNVYYCTGFSGHGFLLGPALGVIMAQMIQGDAPFIDVSGFDTRRFATDDHRPEMNIV